MRLDLSDIHRATPNADQTHDAPQATPPPEMLADQTHEAPQTPPLTSALGPERHPVVHREDANDTNLLAPTAALLVHIAIGLAPEMLHQINTTRGPVGSIRAPGRAEVHTSVTVITWSRTTIKIISTRKNNKRGKNGCCPSSTRRTLKLQRGTLQLHSSWHVHQYASSQPNLSVPELHLLPLFHRR